MVLTDGSILRNHQLVAAMNSYTKWLLQAQRRLLPLRETHLFLWTLVSRVPHFSLELGCRFGLSAAPDWRYPDGRAGRSPRLPGVSRDPQTSTLRAQGAQGWSGRRTAAGLCSRAASHGERPQRAGVRVRPYRPPDSSRGRLRPPAPRPPAASGGAELRCRARPSGQRAEGLGFPSRWGGGARCPDVSPLRPPPAGRRGPCPLRRLGPVRPSGR